MVLSLTYNNIFITSLASPFLGISFCCLPQYALHVLTLFFLLDFHKILAAPANTLE